MTCVYCIHFQTLLVSGTCKHVGPICFYVYLTFHYHIPLMSSMICMYGVPTFKSYLSVLHVITLIGTWTNLVLQIFDIPLPHSIHIILI